MGGAVGGVERDGVVAARTEADLPGGAASAAQLAGGAGNEVAAGAAAGAAAVKACEAVTV